MMKCVLYLAAVFAVVASAQVFAEVNLPLVCAGTIASGKCSVTTLNVDYGADGKYVATPSGVWTLWEDLDATDQVRVCPSDLPAPSVCPVARATVLKSEAATAYTGPKFNVTYTWQAPTKMSDESPLDPASIVGYQINWWTATAPDNVHRAATGNVTTYSIALPAEQVCATLQTISSTANSDPTPQVCIAPKPKTPGAPSNVTVTFGSPG
jgi:hypothetical protein